MACINNRFNQRTGELVLMQRCDKLGNCPRAPHACRELNKKLCACLMDLIHKDL